MPITIPTFDPTEGPTGTQVTLSGVQGIPPNTPVEQIFAYIGSDAILEVSKNSDTEIVVTIPDNAQSGVIALVVGQDFGSTAQPFTVQGDANAPSITRVSPPSTMQGGMASIYGSQLNLVTAVYLGMSIRVPSFNLVNEGMIQFRVPTTAPAASYYVYGRTSQFGSIRSPTMLTVAATGFAEQ